MFKKQNSKRFDQVKVEEMKISQKFLLQTTTKANWEFEFLWISNKVISKLAEKIEVSFQQQEFQNFKLSSQDWFIK